MLKRIKNSIALLLVFALSLGMSTSVFAAGYSNTEEAVTINLFDPDDPSLIAIIDADENARTTSRPNTNYDLDAKEHILILLIPIIISCGQSTDSILWTEKEHFASLPTVPIQNIAW